MAARPITTYTTALTEEQIPLLRSALETRGFESFDKDYAIFAFKKGKLNVTVYEKGPKVLIQGKETADFVSFVLEPEVLGRVELGYEEVTQPEMFEPHIGVDESGKGDFFGPLVIAGAYTDKIVTRHLLDEGVMDSKRITSDAKIRKLSEIIRKAPHLTYHIIVLQPDRYNELYNQFSNLNRLLAWGHATVIENLLQKRPDCPRALSDQFANPTELERALQTKGKTIQVDQRTKAESDIAVAAASILAREAFIDWIDQTSESLAFPLPKGASAEVKKAGKHMIEELGRESLPNYAKMHFKTSQEILTNT